MALKSNASTMHELIKIWTGNWPTVAERIVHRCMNMPDIMETGATLNMLWKQQLQRNAGRS